MIIPRCHVNNHGKDLRLLVDTGASRFIMIDEKHREELKTKEASRSKTIVGNGHKCETVVSVPTSIEIQGLQLTEQIAFMDLGDANFDGVLGKPFLDFLEHNAYNNSFKMSIVRNTLEFEWLDNSSENAPNILKRMFIVGEPCGHETEPKPQDQTSRFELMNEEDVTALGNNFPGGSLLLRFDDYGNVLTTCEGDDYILVLESSSTQIAKEERYGNLSISPLEEEPSTIIEKAIQEQNTADISNIETNEHWKPKLPDEKDNYRDDSVFDRVKTDQNSLEVLQQRGQKFGVDLVDLIKEHGQIFSDSVPTHLVPSRGHWDATLNFKDPSDAHKPICKKVYRLAPDELKGLATMLREMLARGTIRPSNSPWGTPVFLVPKPGGGWRLCCDYRELNSKLIREAYAPPASDSLFDQMQEARIFSSHDATWGYHQLRWRSEDIPRTAIRTSLGTFEFMVMNFGATSAPAQFQRLMEGILRPVLGKTTVCFLDDLTVFSKAVADHINHLRQVYRLLGKNRIFLRLSKCYFLTTKVKFLGWIISNGTLEADKEKLKVIIEWPKPITKKDVRSFAGFCNFYKKLCPDFAGSMTPLFELMKDSVPDTLGESWGKEHDEAFANVKKLLTSPPVIHLACADWQYIVNVDASQISIGAVLSQTNPETKTNHVVEYYSRKLGDAQKNYAPGKLELLAIVVTLEHWKHYLKGAKHKVILYTDHQPLVYLKTTKNPSRLLQRWSDFIGQFDLDIKYVEGEKNPADALSRITLDNQQLELDVKEIDDQHPADGPELHERAYIYFVSKAKKHSEWKNKDYKLNSEIFLRINESFGPFDVELFASAENNHISDFITEQEDAFSKSWSGRNCYGNCPFDNDIIYKMLDKALGEIARAKAFTSFTFILPEWKSSSWYKKFVSSSIYDVVERLPKFTANVFSLPCVDGAKPIRGEEHRSYAGPIQWPVIIVHINSMTDTFIAANADSPQPIQDYDFSDSDFVSGNFSDNMFDRLKTALEQDKLYQRVKNKDASIKHPQNFTLNDGLLFWRKDNNASLYIPSSMPNLRKYIFSQCHGNPVVGHFGVKKTLARIRRNYWWSGMVRDVRENISHCRVCVTCKRSNLARPSQTPHAIPYTSWETVFMDEVSGFPPSNNCDAIWVFVDKLSHMVHLAPIKKQGFTSEKLADTIYSVIFKYHGVPRKFVHDRDTRLVDIALRKFCSLVNVTQNVSTAAHPQTDSTGEATVKLVIDVLRQFVNAERDNWFELLPAIEFAINSAPGLAGYSPFEIVYSKQPTSPDNILTRMKLSSDDSVGRALRTTNKLRRYGQAIHKVRKHLKRIADAVANPKRIVTRRVNDIKFKEGDLVLLHKSFAGKLYAQDKLAPIWVGPFEVLVAHHPSYKLALPQVMEINDTIHIEKLKALPLLDADPDEEDIEPEPFPRERLVRGSLAIQGHTVKLTEGTRFLLIKIRSEWKHAHELALRGHFDELYKYVDLSKINEPNTLVGRVVKLKLAENITTPGIITKEHRDKIHFDVMINDAEKSGTYTRSDFILPVIRNVSQSQPSQNTERTLLLNKYKATLRKKHRLYEYKVLEICCGKSKSFSRSFKRSFPKAEIVTVDIDKEYDPTHCVDIRYWNILEHYPKHYFDICWISTPCNEYSYANTTGTRDWNLADDIAKAAIRILIDIEPTIWFWENPLAHLQKRPFMQMLKEYLQTTSYCKYGTPFMKPTGIYSNIDLQLLPKCSAAEPCEYRQNLSFHPVTAQSGPSSTGAPGVTYLTSQCIPNKLVKHIVKLATTTLQTSQAEENFRPERIVRTLNQSSAELLNLRSSLLKILKHLGGAY